MTVNKEIFCRVLGKVGLSERIVNIVRRVCMLTPMLNTNINRLGEE